MKFIKRTICLLLSVFVITGSLAVFADEDLSDNVNRDALNKMEILKMLNIIPDYEEYNVQLEKAVTRGEFAEIIANLINAEKYSGKTSYFYDVPISHRAYSAVNVLASRNIISGLGGKLFKPDEPIAAVDALKILLRVMGYGEYAEQYNGGYPTGYITTANRTGISKGIDLSGTFSNAKMYLLLYKAMTTEMFKEKQYSASGMSYAVSDDTLLSFYHDIYYVRGVLNGANGVSLTAGNTNNINDVQIDDTIYETEIDVFQYLGEKIEAFYHHDEEMDINTVIWMKPYGDSEVLNISVDNDASFDLNTFSLTYVKENGRNAHVKLDSNCILIYNGKIVTENYDDYFNRSSYSLKLISRNGSKNDVAIMREYQNMVVGFVNKDNLKVSDKYNASHILELNGDSYDSLKVLRNNGNEAAVTDIIAGNVLSLFESEDGKYLEIIISSDEVSGTLSAVSEQAYEYELTVDGEKYIYPKSAGAFSCSAGSSVNLKLDAFGKVADIETKSAGDEVSYLIKAMVYTEDFSGEDRMYLKVLYGGSGEVEKFDCKDTIIIDGKKYKDMEEAYKCLSNSSGETIQQLVMLTLNQDNEITKIDTAAMGPGEGEGNLQIHVNRMKGIWRRSDFDGRMSINGATRIFIVPPAGVEANDDNYMIVKQADTAEYVSGVYVTSYKTKEKVGSEQYVVMEQASDSTFEQIPFLIQGIEMTVDDDDEVREQISGYLGNAEARFMAADGLSFTDMGLTRGCLIKIAKDKRGKVVSIKKIATPEDVKERKKSFDGSWGLGSIHSGEIIDVVDGILMIDTRDADEDPEGWVDADDLRIDCKSSTIVIWDSDRRNDNISIGTYADAMPGDYVVVDTRYEWARTVYIFKQ
jgi:hypothetical protein